MQITKREIEHLYAIDDEIQSGGQRASFRIIAILDDLVRIQPTQSPTKSRLRYDKLAIVVDAFDEVDPNRIEATVGTLLNRHGLKDTQNESYLYGLAREFLARSPRDSLEKLESQLAKEIERSNNSSDEERKKRLLNAPTTPERMVVTTTAFRRNADVIVETLKRANGICEQCHQNAPFIRRDGTPFLEVHHRTPLKSGGQDTVENAIAVCPNCHRRAHHA